MEDVKYKIAWPDIEEEILKDFKNRIVYIEEDNAKRITFTFDDFNYLIEGDNYLSLSILATTYKEKIDIIYIDPPYNTGNSNETGFKYNDRYINKDDEWYHSCWLSFMHKRLFLAKQLLKDTGVIFISIDDHEQAQLKLLCDEIFNNSNFICQFIWKRSGAGGLRGNFPITNHEYILTYANDISKIKTTWYSHYTEENDKSFTERDEVGDYKLQSLYSTLLNQTDRQCYYIKCPDGSLVKPKRSEKGSWRYIEETFLELLNKNLIVFKESVRSPLIDSYGNQSKYYIYIKEYKKESANPFTFLPSSLPRTRASKSELKQLGFSFEYAKPIGLIEYLLFMVQNKNALILDFFAGSGTTGHAVLELNKKDGGNRKFILCTNNENNICTDICYPRLKKVIEGYDEKKRNGIPANLIYQKVQISQEKYEDGKLEVLLDQNKKKVGKYLRDLVKIKEGSNKIQEQKEYYEIYSNEEVTKMVLVCFEISDNFTEENLQSLIKSLPTKNDKEQEIIYKYYLPEEFSNEEISYFNYPNDIYNDFLLGGTVVE